MTCLSCSKYCKWDFQFKSNVWINIFLSNSLFCSSFKNFILFDFWLANLFDIYFLKFSSSNKINSFISLSSTLFPNKDLIFKFIVLFVGSLLTIFLSFIIWSINSFKKLVVKLLKDLLDKISFLCEKMTFLCDVYFGSRKHPKSEVNSKFHREFLGLIMQISIRLLCCYVK